jgi:hypothetical protein
MKGGLLFEDAMRMPEYYAPVGVVPLQDE